MESKITFYKGDANWADLHKVFQTSFSGDWKIRLQMTGEFYDNGEEKTDFRYMHFVCKKSDSEINNQYNKKVMQNNIEKMKTLGYKVIQYGNK